MKWGRKRISRLLQRDGRSNLHTLSREVQGELAAFDSLLREDSLVSRVQWADLHTYSGEDLASLTVYYGTLGVKLAPAMRSTSWKLNFLCSCGGERREEQGRILCRGCGRDFGAWRGNLLGTFLDGVNDRRVSEQSLRETTTVVQDALGDEFDVLTAAALSSSVETWLEEFYATVTPLRW